MTAKTPKISVLMPIYNTNPVYLRAAIESILNQTFPDFEFLILNDSPQNTELDQIIATYSDQRIRYFKNKKTLGIADGHNFLLEQAIGKYIALMDHDDISLPHRLEKQFNFLESHPDIGLCGTACHRFGRLFKTGDIFYPKNHDEIAASLFFRCPILHPSTMIRHSLLDGIKWDKRFISLNDRKLYLDLADKTHFHNLQDVLYRYRLSPEMTSKKKQTQIQDEQKLFRKIYLKKANLSLSAKEEKTLNNYVLKGRCRIKSRSVLEEVYAVLSKLAEENKNNKTFQKICAKYLIKRCKNAAFYGHVPCSDILGKTKLPVKVPFALKIYMKLEKFF